MIQRPLIKWAVVLFLVVLDPYSHAKADVASVVVTPSTATIPQNRTSSLSLVWTVTSGPAGFHPVGLVSSNGAVVRDPANNLLGTIGGTISSDPPIMSVPQTTVISEALSIPQSIIAQANQNGFRQIIITRTFDDNGVGNPSASITANITGRIGSLLGISRIQVFFDDQSPVKTVLKNQKITAFAQILYSGSGSLRGVWEGADPTSTSGTPVFRALGFFNRNVTGGRTIQLESPPLPTMRAGVHIVRFNVLDPKLTSPPQIAYYVKEDDAKGKRAVLLDINPLVPPPLGEVKPGALFQWGPVPDALQYRIHFYAENDVQRKGAATIYDKNAPNRNINAAPLKRVPTAPPLAGAIVPGSQSTYHLTPMTLEHMKAGSVYWWCVRAYDKNNYLIGESSCRPIRVPMENRTPKKK